MLKNHRLYQTNVRVFRDTLLTAAEIEPKFAQHRIEDVLEKSEI